MMHTFRLLNMAEEIAAEGVIHVRRNDRDFLLEIRRGAFEYEELVERAHEKLARMDALYEHSALPEKPDFQTAESCLFEMREYLYES